MYLGIDYGKKRIGLALGKIIPKGLGVLDASKGLPSAVEEINKICVDNEVELIIVGVPILENGEAGSLSSEINDFIKLLEEKTGLKVVLENEAFTSSEAERILQERKIEYSRKGGEKDELSAILILEQYIDSQK